MCRVYFYWKFWFQRNNQVTNVATAIFERSRSVVGGSSAKVQNARDTEVRGTRNDTSNRLHSYYPVSNTNLDEQPAVSFGHLNRELDV
jgi:hypothetical protein